MSRERSAAKRARRKKAMPPWLTKDQHREIRKFYAMAAMMHDENGKVFHVDHIVPLNGESVSGLHVPWNLQILSPKENMKKYNKFKP